MCCESVSHMLWEIVAVELILVIITGAARE